MCKLKYQLYNNLIINKDSKIFLFKHHFIQIHYFYA